MCNFEGKASPFIHCSEFHSLSIVRDESARSQVKSHGQSAHSRRELILGPQVQTPGGRLLVLLSQPPGNASLYSYRKRGKSQTIYASYKHTGDTAQVIHEANNSTTAHHLDKLASVHIAIDMYVLSFSCYMCIM